MSEVISSFKSLRAESQVFALLMLFLCVLLHTILWISGLVIVRVELSTMFGCTVG